MRLTRLERRWAEEAFAAVLPAEREGLPALASLDRERFWACVEGSGAPTLVPGLRAMLLLLQVLPVVDRRFLRTFGRLSGEDRERFLAGLEASPLHLLRQVVATLKILACFAWFDDPRARASVPR